jgi:hypothetical protein
MHKDRLKISKPRLSSNSNDKQIIYILNTLLCFFQLRTKSVDQSHSWEANSRSASQKIPSIYGDKHKGPTSGPYPFPHESSTYLPKYLLIIHFKIILPPTYA